MREHRFDEIDQVGQETLEVISSANKFNIWMYDTIKPYLKGKVLEIGSGIGNISDYLYKDGFNLMLSDIRQNYVSTLRKKYAGNKNFINAKVLDLADPDFDNKYANLFNSFDCIFALNVVEHIEKDNEALSNCHKLLKKDGHLIILVPAYSWLYCNFDKKLGHFRRYTSSKLIKLFNQNELNILHKQYFNFMGILGWLVSGKILKKKTIPGDQMRLYNRLVPIFKVIDRIFFHSVGLSTVVVGKKL